MKKIKLSTFLDGIFIFFLSFFIFYSLIKGGVRKISTASLVSAIFSSIITFLFCYLSEKFFAKKDVSLLEKNRYDAFCRMLYFSSDKEVLSLIKDYYLKKELKGVIKSGGYFIEEKLFVFYSFTPENVSFDKVISAYKKTPKGLSTVFLASGYDGACLEFFAPFEKVKLYTIKDFYLCLKEEDLLPEIELPYKKRKLKNPFKGVLKRENSKKFFLWGAVFTVFSTVTFYKWLYLFIGVIFLFISCYLRFFKTFSEKQKTELI